MSTTFLKIANIFSFSKRKTVLEDDMQKVCRVAKLHRPLRYHFKSLLLFFEYFYKFFIIFNAHIHYDCVIVFQFQQVSDECWNKEE